jgi:hypothetical protein
MEQYKELDGFDMVELLRIYKIQINTGNIDCIDYIKKSIKNKVFSDLNSLLIGGNGCFSEWRNSFKFFTTDIRKSIVNICTEKELEKFDDYVFEKYHS